MTGLSSCPPGRSGDVNITCNFKRHKGSMVERKTCVTQTVYLLNLGTHSFFQILYTLLSSHRIFYPSSFFFFQFSHFLIPGQFFPSSPKLKPVSFSSVFFFFLAIYTASVSFAPFPLACSALYMFSLAFVYLEFFLHHSWIKLFKSFTINNLNEKRTFNKIKIIGFIEIGEYLK